MDYFQGVINEYLRARRTTFVNTEYLLQLDPGDVYAKQRHWYCDAVAIDHADFTVELCEVSYSKTLQSLFKRLQAWSNHWPDIVIAVHRDSALKGSWAVRPRVFIPEEARHTFERKIALLKWPSDQSPPMPIPTVTAMEEVLPWMYRSWNGKAYKGDADC